MPFASCDALGCGGLAWALKLLPSKDTEASVRLAGPFTSTF
jgi:hypothetical protein